MPPLPLPFINTFFSLSLFFLFPTYLASDAEGYTACAPFSCGNFSDISYPFWSSNQPDYCGHPKFKLDCQQDNVTIDIKSQKFQVVDIIEKSQILKIARLDLLGLGESRPCPEQINVNFDLDFFSYTSNDQNYTILYNCSSHTSSLPKLVDAIPFTCLIDGAPHDAYLALSSKVMNSNYVGCKNVITVPVQSPTSDSSSVGNVLGKGFEVKWSGVNGDKCDRCINSGGRCGYNASINVFMCLCLNKQSYDGICSKSPALPIVPPTPIDPYSESEQPHRNTSKWNWERKLAIGIGSATIAGMFMCIIICCIIRKSSIWQERYWLTTKKDLDIETFLKDHRALLQKRYKYSEVKKMTNSFKDKLGQGGFGAVYKGKLLNGRLVAVKILKASKGNGEEFINEVASISRTSHVNIVNLLGFCFEGYKKALIYEFMSNGSLDKLIYNKGNNKAIASLNWENLYQISIGIAQGLEYLHRGCNTRILHFDIKPHNILLDENLCPKISDFGLAKLCPRKESNISMSDARGTMGYVAPEIWNRHFGGVSHKSDVYSYGMMILEMVGGRKNINAEASHTSEIYFPHWVYNRLELGNDLRHGGVIAAEENEIARRMAIVGLWCIQTFPSDRPTMSRVIDMLEGNMNSLEMPPKPFLSSPSRSVPESSTS